MLRVLDDIGSPATVASNGPRYFGFVIGGRAADRTAASMLTAGRGGLCWHHWPGSAERTHRVIAAVQDDGTCWNGPTTWQGVRAMRVSVSGWSTTDDDIDKKRCGRPVVPGALT